MMIQEESVLWDEFTVRVQPKGWYGDHLREVLMCLRRSQRSGRSIDCDLNCWQVGYFREGPQFVWSLFCGRSLKSGRGHSQCCGRSLHSKYSW